MTEPPITPAQALKLYLSLQEIPNPQNIVIAPKVRHYYYSKKTDKYYLGQLP